MKTQVIMAIATIIFSTTFSFAVETKVTKEDRQKMAEIHTKMATCLKSDKPMSDCQSEMMKSCKDMMGKSGCPMMDGMGQMKGMMNGQGMMMGHSMMGQEEETKSDKKSK